MSFKVQQPVFRSALATVSRAVPSRSTLPVLSNIAITGEDDKLILAATNMEVSLRVEVEAEVEEEFATTLPAKLLNDFVSNLPDEEVRGEYEERVEVVRLECAGYEANIKGVGADEFPLIPQVEDGFALPAETLKQLIDATVFSAATDESRPILTGVLVELNDGITLAAADGFRLGVARADVAVSEATQVIPPARALQELGRLLGEENVQVAIPETRNQIMFKTNGVELVAQLIEGNFPDYNQIVPDTSTTRTIVDRTEFRKAVKVASIFSREAANIVRLNLEDDIMTVSATSSELGDTETDVTVNMEGDPIEIAFNAQYLLDVLNACTTEQVAMETGGASKPGKFGLVEGEYEWTAVVMPMHIR